MSEPKLTLDEAVEAKLTELAQAIEVITSYRPVATENGEDDGCGCDVCEGVAKAEEKLGELRAILTRLQPTPSVGIDEAVERISEAAIEEFDIPCGADKLYAMRDFEKATTAILTRWNKEMRDEREKD